MRGPARQPGELAGFSDACSRVVPAPINCIDAPGARCYGFAHIAAVTKIPCTQYCFAVEDTKNQTLSFDGAPMISA